MRLPHRGLWALVGLLLACSGRSKAPIASDVATQSPGVGGDVSTPVRVDSGLKDSGAVEDSSMGAPSDAAVADGAVVDDAGTRGSPGIPVNLEPAPDCVHPVVTRDCSDGLCTIPPGCYIMGAPRDSLASAQVSNIQVQVTLSHGFVVGETEVTRAQWFALDLPEPRTDWTEVWETEDPNAIAPDNTLCLEPDCPVNWIGFEDAVAYANLRSEAEGFRPCYLLADCIRSPGDGLRCMSVRIDAASPYECEGYRLPTDAEWEYAARAGTETDFYSGNLDPSVDSDSFDCELDLNLDRIAWYCANSGHPSHRVGTGQPHPVAQKQPNDFGLYDVAGNLFEWVNDRMTPGGYGTGPLVDPINGVDDPSDLTPNTPIYSGEVDGLFSDGFPDHRTQRGGAFDFFSRLTASSIRISSHAGSHRAGFRIVRTLGLATEQAEAEKAVVEKKESP